MADVLFEVTKDNLESGLRGVPVGYCTTSTVDPTKGLFYVGQPVDQLALRTPESVMYLLYYGKEPTPEQLKAFQGELRKRAPCKPELLHQISELPRQGHPMNLFCVAILLAGTLEGVDDYREDCMNLIAKVPEIAAAVINHHAGWGGINASKPELGYMENFTQMLKAPKADQAALLEVFRLFDVLHFDHGGGNLSTFVGKAVASGLADMYESISAAMCALAGPRHGRANQDCLEFIHKMHQDLGDNTTPEAMEAYIRKLLANNELLFGFGHAVLRVEDPRATVLFKTAMEKYPNDPLVKITKLLREVGPKVLGENPKISDPYPNVDMISGTLLTAAGFPYPEYYTILFGMSRVVGIAIQIVYERCEARGGKGTPIVRPKYLYKPREA